MKYLQELIALLALIAVLFFAILQGADFVVRKLSAQLTRVVELAGEGK